MDESNDFNWFRAESTSFKRFKCIFDLITEETGH